MGTSAEKSEKPNNQSLSKSINTDISNKYNKNSNVIEDKKEQNVDCKIMLEFHNKYRERHKSNKLKIKPELNDKANEYAKYLVEQNSLTNQNIFNMDENLGENIFFSDKKEKVINVCNKWYNENKNFKYGLNNFQKDTNHFTQLIWNSTTDVGFGFYNTDNIYCYVALYYPQGNIFGQFTNNVFMPKE